MSATPRSLGFGYTIVQSLRFETEHPGGECTLVIRLSQDTDPTSPIVTLQFIGVTNLVLSGIGGGFSQISGLAVEDISSQQLDRLNWRVVDLEDQKIEFMCQHYEVTQ